MKTLFLVSTAFVSTWAEIGYAQTTDGQSDIGQNAPGVATTTEAQAAEDQTATAPALEEIVVTAQRRSENLQRTPVAVSAVSAPALEVRGVSTPGDLSRIVPAVKITSAGGGSQQITMRGVGTLSANVYAEPAVAANLDGVYLARPSALTGTFFDLERVEVLKGPQGTLYGRNATSGAVNLITRKPDMDDFGGNIMGEIGSLDKRLIEGALNIPLSQGAAMRISGQLVRRDGIYTDGTGDQDETGARLHLLGEPLDNLTVLFTGDYRHTGGRGPASVLTPYVDPSNPYVASTDPRVQAIYRSRGLRPLLDDTFLDIDHYGLAATIEWRPSFATLTVVPAFRRANILYRHNNPGFRIDNDETSDQYSFEARLASPDGQRDFRWLVGGYAFNERQSALLVSDQTTSFNVSDVDDLHTRSLAVFGQVTASLTDALRVTGGLRYTDEKKTQEGFAILRAATCPAPGVFFTGDPIPPGFVPQRGCRSPIDGKVDTKQVTWRVGADYDIGPQSLVYVNVGTGFKAGGFFAAASTALRPNTFKPERLLAYSAGTKNRFFDNRLQLNLEVFYWKYKDKQVTHLGPVDPSGFALITENAGKATFYGGELEAALLVTPNDRLGAVLQYNHSNYDSFVYRQTTATGSPTTNCPTTPSERPQEVFVNCSGLVVPLAPEVSLTVNYEHVFEFSNGATLVPAASLQYESSYLVGEERYPSQTQDAYTTGDITLTFNAPGRRWSLTGYIYNIADEVIKISSFVQPILRTPTLGLRPPLTYGARVNFNF